MKAYRNPVWIGLAALVMGALLVPEATAQPQPSAGMLPASAAPASDTISADQEAALIELLDASFQSLADQDQLGRRIGGYTMVGLGIGSFVGGAATLALGEGDDARIVGYSLLGGGVLLGGLSLIPFKVRSEAERLYAAFRRMPAEEPGQVHRKYVYGDRRFEELARKSRQERIIGGALTIAGAGVASLVLVKSSPEERLHTFLWPALGGAASVLIKSAAERRYETYRQAKEDVLSRRAGAELVVAIVPVARGRVAGAVQVRF